MSNFGAKKKIPLKHNCDKIQPILEKKCYVQKQVIHAAICDSNIHTFTCKHSLWH